MKKIFKHTNIAVLQALELQWKPHTSSYFGKTINIWSVLSMQMNINKMDYVAWVFIDYFFPSIRFKSSATDMNSTWPRRLFSLTNYKLCWTPFKSTGVYLFVVNWNFTLRQGFSTQVMALPLHVFTCQTSNTMSLFIKCSLRAHI